MADDDDGVYIKKAHREHMKLIDTGKPKVFGISKNKAMFLIEDDKGIREERTFSWWFFILAAIVAIGGWYILTQIRF